MTAPRRSSLFAVVGLDDGDLRDLVLGTSGPTLVCFLVDGDPRRDELTRHLPDLASSVGVRCVLAAAERCPTTAALLGACSGELLLLAGGLVRARLPLHQSWCEVQAVLTAALGAIRPGPPLVILKRVPERS